MQARHPLASAAAVIERLSPYRRRVVFHSISGVLTVDRRPDDYVMNFPARPTEPVEPPPGLTEALGARPVEVATDHFNYLVLLESAGQVRSLSPDMAVINRPTVRA